MLKVKAIVSNSEVPDVMETVRYAMTVKDADRLQLEIANIVYARMDKNHPDYTEGVKWGVKFEVEDVTDKTVLEDLTLGDLKMFMSLIADKKI